MDEPIIKIRAVSKFFKIPHERRHTLKEHFVNIFRRREFEKFQALQNVSFEMKKGEFLGIIGRNGSGKSTLLKVIAGILKPNAGQVIVNGTIAPFLELGVGFQGDLSARDNVYLYGAILGLSRKEIDSKFASIIKFAELENFVDQKLKNFSSGMQVRLAFSTAIQAEADILLLDEVLAVGDLNFQKKCYEVFKDYKIGGKTIIFVSHNLSAIQQFCSSVLVLQDGQLMYRGSASEAIRHYQQGEGKYQTLWNKLAQQQNSLDYILPNRNAAQFWREGEQEAVRLEKLYIPDSTVLEIGVGVGRILKYVGRRAKKVIGIDVSQEYINQAKNNLIDDKRIKDFKLILTDGTTIPVPDNSVDLVYSINTFLHLNIEDVAKYLKEARRILRKNGRIFIILPNNESKYYAVTELQGFTHRFDRQDIIEIMRTAGFEHYTIKKGKLVGYASLVPEEEMPEYIISGNV
ncbi:MAG: ATP-binding cassette domain-containing protein [Patescibacteria group bacterium]|jgi:ABC-type polysaccharide/polyol phosphate transport system ATPase subunit/ubiquinone/menaquinone biosynthesis C-methylase UbiE